MKTIPFGQSGLTVTPLGLGLAALGRPGYINLGHADDLAGQRTQSALAAQAHRMLDAAWAAGIRYFDAARSYGLAETFLSTWLHQRHIEPTQVTVGSKWGYTYTAAWQVNLPAGEKHEVKEHSLAVLQRQVAESQELLAPYLDLYQIHSATLDSGVLDNTAVLTQLARLRAAGLGIGLSVSGAQQAETIWKALKTTIDGQPLFSAVQATWNILEQSTTAALQAAHAAGLGVIIKEAVANGRLTSRNQMPDFQAQRARLEALATANQTTIDALALAAVCNQPFVDVALSGAAQIPHLQANLQALTVTWTPALAAALLAFQEPAGSYWHTRSQLAWN